MAHILRRLMERMSRGYAYQRSLPPHFGRTPIYVSPDAQLKYLKFGSNVFDQRLLDIVVSHISSQSCVWDVGANVGVFSFAAASIAKEGNVLAIEPDLFLVSLIKRSLKLRRNLGLRMQVLPAAISHSNGVSEFHIASRGRAANFLRDARGRDQAGGSRESNLVPTFSLDELLKHFAPPTFVKVDVEGAEAMVLRGAGKLLGEVRPTIYIEVGPGSSLEVNEILNSYGYRLFDGDRPLLGQEQLMRPAWNTLAIPR